MFEASKQGSPKVEGLQSFQWREEGPQFLEAYNISRGIGLEVGGEGGAVRFSIPQGPTGKTSGIEPIRHIVSASSDSAGCLWSRRSRR
jgi:hypothetical protein